jgi:hypothetical protein
VIDFGRIRIHAILSLRFRRRLPLHVIRGVGAAALQGVNVIDDVAWTSSVRGMSSWAGMLSPESATCR